MKKAWLLLVAPLAVACSSTLAAAPPHALVVPSPQATPMELCWLEYSHTDKSAGYAHAGSSSRPAWHITASGLLIRHPKGHLLLDLGNSTHFDEELGELGFVERQYRKLGPGGLPTQKSIVQALAEVHELPSQLSGLVVSHVHPDHVGGIDNLPDVPVLLPQEELDYAARMNGRGSFAVTGAHALALARRGKPLTFATAPYETFDTSLDYFGDGSVVFVLLAGHTPGSLGTFVSRDAQRRLFHVGDAVDTTEAIDKRVGKSWALGWTDDDRARADAVVSVLSALHAQDPELRFLPAHDRDAWAALFPSGPGTCVGP